MQNHLKAAEWMVNILDNQFQIAGVHVGFAGLINLIPGFGDLLTASLSLYIVWIAFQMKLPTYRILQMFGNILLSFILGLIPILGDAAYVLRQTNYRNFQILKKYAPTNVIQGKLIAST